MQLIRAIHRRLFHRVGDPAFRSVRIAQWVCFGLFLFTVVYLVDAREPWNIGIQERLEAGKKLTLEQDRLLGFYFAAAFNGVVSVVMFFLAKWWAAPLRPDPLRNRPPSTYDPVPGRVFLVALLFAVLLAGFLRYPLASKSLWWDETWSLQRVVLGEWERNNPEDPDDLEWDARDWDRTLFYYQKPTNHIPYSVASRLALDTWRAVTGAPPDAFHEFVYRLPAYLAALLSVVALALLLREFGYARAGMAAAFLLALHPWHIRYGVDARAFSFVVLFSLLSVHQLAIALRTCQWRHFIFYGVSMFALLWTFPYALYFTVALVVAGFAAIITGRRFAGVRRGVAGRFFAGNCLAVCLLVFFIFPLVPQLVKWTDEIHGNNMIDVPFLKDLASNLVNGMIWTGAVHPSWEGIPSFDGFSVPVRVAIFVVGGILALAGMLRLLCDRTPASYLVPAMVLSPVLAIGYAYLDTHYFYTRYVIYALPVLLLLVSVGVESVAMRLRRGRHPGELVLGLFALLVAGYALISLPQTRLLLERPISPNREVADAARRLVGGSPDCGLAAGFNLGGRMPQAYYKHIRYVDDLGDLRAITDEARARRLPLYLFYGYESFNRVNEPDPFPYLDNPELFRKIADFRGIEPAMHYQLFRYTGQPLEPGS